MSPIVFGARFHGQNSYKQYYNNRVNGGRLKSTTASYEMEESYPNGDVLRLRNDGDTYAKMTQCDNIFCEDIPAYPQGLVNQLLTRNSSLLQYAQQDIIAVSPRFDNEEEPLCLSEERLISPKEAVNQNDESFWILQSDEMNFHQTLRIEICKEQDAKCKIVDDFTEGYVTTCKQKYIYREMIAISKDGSGKPIRDYFRLPASCCCHIQMQIDNINLRQQFSEDTASFRRYKNTYNDI